MLWSFALLASVINALFVPVRQIESQPADQLPGYDDGKLLRRSDGIPHRYIVKLKDGITPEQFVRHQEEIQHKQRLLERDLPESHEFFRETPELSSYGIQMHIDNSTVYLGYFTEETLAHLTNDLLVDIVEQDVYSRLEFDIMMKLDSQIQGRATDLWALHRISSRLRLSSKLKAQLKTAVPPKYFYPKKSGQGVDVYVIDSGVDLQSSELRGQDISAKSIMGAPLDESGHGTACAGLIVGKKYGVTDKSHVYSVKTFDEDKQAPTLIAMQGVSWAIDNHRKRKGTPGFKGSVISYSGSSPFLKIKNTFFEQAIKEGMFVVVASGNQGVDACSRSPGSSRHVITVGSTDINDNLAWYMNYGGCVDILAPGTNVKTAALSSSDEEFRTASGTSMSTPIVAGIVSQLLSYLPDSKSQFSSGAKFGQTQMKRALIGSANDLQYQPSPDSPPVRDTPLKIVYNGAGRRSWMDKAFRSVEDVPEEPIPDDRYTDKFEDLRFKWGFQSSRT